jgi:hypothetical protein
MSGKILQFKQKSKEPEVNPVDQIIDEMRMLLCVLADEEVLLLNEEGEEITFTPTAHVAILTNGQGQLIIQHSTKERHDLEDILIQVLESIQQEQEQEQEEDEVDG